MRNCFKRIMVLMAAAIFALSCCGLQVALAAGGMSVFVIMSNYVAGEQITVMWYNNVAGADHYDCTVLNQSTGYYPRKRSTSSSGYDCYISGSKVEAGNYKVWVGAVDANGDVIDDGYAYFTVNEATDCDHKWDAETGTCKWCDEECRHNNGVYEIETKSTGKSISDTKHEIIDTYNEECKICRHVLNTGLTKSETGRHSFDSNGDCVLCDYRAACKHRETTTEHLSTSYDLHNDTKHAVKVVSNIICANKNCGKLIEYGGSIEVYYEYHDMQNNRCTLCGYAIQYDPVSVNISRGQASAYVGESIHASCSASGGSGDYTYYWCVYRDGSEIYQTADWNKYGSIIASSEGAYTFYVRVEDRNTGSYASATTSTISVTKAPCQHTNTTTLQDGDTQYIKVSDSKHTVRTNWVEVCGDCGTKLSAWYSDEAQDHNYANGNCVNCGSAEPAPSPTECAHPSMRSVESSRSTRTIASDEQHLVDITWEDYCEACGILLNKTRTTTEYQAHTYDGLVCTLCGYAKQDPNATVPCDHANHSKEEISSEIKPYDDQMHVVLTTYKVSCADCGIMLNETASETNYEAHRYINGICACGQVGHVHNYEKIVVSKPTYTNLNTNEHSVTTTYYTKCSGCGDTTAQVTDSTNEAHSYTDKGHIEAEHHDGEGHKTFDRCVCGAVNYTGYATYKNCCGCHGHVWQDVKIENGKWREYCKNCKTYRQATAPVEDNKEHVHDYSYKVTTDQNHPHQMHGTCSCGDYALLPDMYGMAVDCCQCSGHLWTNVFRSGKKYIKGCTRCNYQEEVTPSADNEAFYALIDELNASAIITDTYKEIYTIDKQSNRIWKVIASQATDKLQDSGFVITKYALDAASDISGTLSDTALKKLKIVDEKTWDAQKQEYWTELLIELLNQETKDVKGIDKTTEIADSVSDYAQRIAKYADKKGQTYLNASDHLSSEYIDVEIWIKKLDDQINTLKEQLALDPDFSANYNYQLNELYNKKAKLSILRDESVPYQQKYESIGKKADKVGNVAMNISTALETFSIIYEGTSAISALNDTLNDLTSILNTNDQYIEKLNGIIECAGPNSNLGQAAAAMKERLEEENKQATNRVLSGIGVGLEKAGEVIISKASEDAVSAVIDAIPSYLDVVEFAGKALDTIFNWDEAFSSAETLMTLSVMDAEMNVLGEASNKEGYQYYTQLWAVLQSKGDQYASQLLEYWSTSRGLDMKKDYGLSTNNQKNSAQDILGKEQQRFLDFMKKLSPNECSEVPKQQYCIIIKVSSGNVRNAPSKDADKVDIVGMNERYTVYDTRTDASGSTWYQIDKGWIHSGITEPVN